MKLISLFLFLFLGFSLHLNSQANTFEPEPTSSNLIIEGGLINVAPISGTTSIELKRLDNGLNTIAIDTIDVPELSIIGYASILYFDWEDGVLLLTACLQKFALRGTDYVSIYLDMNLTETARAFVSAEEYKKSLEAKDVLAKNIPALYGSKSLATSDGHLCLYKSKEFSTLVRYVIKDKKYSIAWSQKIKLTSISAYKIIGREGKIFAAIISGLDLKGDDGYGNVYKGVGQLNIIRMDLGSGEQVWNNQIAMSVFLRPELPVLSFDKKTGNLCFAGIESITDNWKKEKKSGKIICNLYIGLIDKNSDIKIKRLQIPSFTDEFVGTKIDVERPWWVPKKIAIRADGSYLIAGTLGFNSEKYATIDRCGYLEGPSWLAGYLYLSFDSDIKNVKISSKCFDHFDWYGGGILSNRNKGYIPSMSLYWDPSDEILYMGLINFYEKKSPTTDYLTFGYYLVKISATESTITKIRTEKEMDNYYITAVGPGFVTFYRLNHNDVFTAEYVKN